MNKKKFISAAKDVINLEIKALQFLKKSLNYGITSFVFLVLYGIFRIIAEQFREPDKHIGYIFNFISLGSLLSIAMIIFAFIFVSKINLNEKS